MTPAARAFAKKATAASKGGQYAYGYMPTQTPKVYDAAGDGALPGRPDMPDAPPNTPRPVAPPKWPPPVAVEGESAPVTPAPQSMSQTRAGRRRRPTAVAVEVSAAARVVQLCDLAAGAGLGEVGLGGRGAAGALRVGVPALLDGAATRLSAATLAEAAVRSPRRRRQVGRRQRDDELEEYVHDEAAALRRLPEVLGRCCCCAADERLANGVERFVGAAAAALGGGTSFTGSRWCRL